MRLFIGVSAKYWTDFYNLIIIIGNEKSYEL